MKYINITFKDPESFFKYYPDSIYKNMYLTGILNGKSK